MASALNVIALISGGKDSLFSILHCLENGYQVVALANLYPKPTAAADGLDPEDAPEDIDSYMYQTIGHRVIPLYEEALGLPLYREPIVGTAVNADKAYAPDGSSGDLDETESLVPLLKKVMQRHPEANAVSTGAILSNYQRTRVESVALRLGLVPLSFLWQWPSLPPYTQTSLLRDMQAVGQNARIIKVASGGVDESFLWENVADSVTVRRLERAMGRFGGGDGAVLGEGGEYETLAINGPSKLWKGRIEAEVVTEMEGGVGKVRIVDARVVQNGVTEQEVDTLLRIPNYLDDEFEALLGELTQIPIAGISPGQEQKPDLDGVFHFAQLSQDTDLAVSNILPPLTSLGASAAEQMAAVVRLLTELHIKPADIAFTTILLRSMADFAQVNATYGELFTLPEPPARVTVACGDLLPNGVQLVLSFQLFKGPRSRRRGLHVQSRSYWAPANIGPYSQAVAVPLSEEYRAELVHVAGQIPLVPATMDVVRAKDVGRNGDDMQFKVQAALSLQHLWRIGRTMSVSYWLGAVAFITAADEEDARRKATIAETSWREAHKSLLVAGEEDEEEDIDPWDRKNRVGSYNGERQHQRRPLPDTDSVTSAQAGSDRIPPMFTVEVDELPRGAQIEWASTGVGNGQIETETRQLDHDDKTPPVCLLRVKEVHRSFIWCGLRDVERLSQFETALEGLIYERGDIGEITDALYTVYTTRKLPGEWARRMQPQVIPCRRIYGSEGIALEAVVVVSLRESTQ